MRLKLLTNLNTLLLVAVCLALGARCGGRKKPWNARIC